MSAQKPLELILARNLLSTISTPAFLVGEGGALLYFNEAAAMLLGRSFEETGTMEVQEWTATFGPFDEAGEPMPHDENPATVALRQNQPYHGTFRICAAAGVRDIVASTIPLVGQRGSSGAIVIFWPVKDDEVSERSSARGEGSETT